MGCAQSKPLLHRRARASEAVALCRDRSHLLAKAIRHRYQLADAHRAYAASLQATGAALHDFLRAVVIQDASPPPPPVPGADDVPPLPAQRTEEQGAADPQHVRSPPDNSGDGDGHVRFPSEDEGDVDGHILFPPEETDDEDDGDDGHIQFPSDEETEPPIPQPEHDLLPQPEHPLPQPEQPLPQPDHLLLPRPGHHLPQPDHLLPRPRHVLPQTEPLQPEAPLQMPAPYGYAPPYTYGSDPGLAYAYGAEMGTYGPDPAPAYAYGGAEMGTYGPAPSYAYGGAEMGTYGPAPTYAYGGAEMGIYSSSPAYAYGVAEMGTYSSSPAYAYSGAEMGTYSSSPAYAYGAGEVSTYGSAPAYGYGADMDSSYGHSFVSTMNYARSQPSSPSVTYEHISQVTNATVHYHQNDGAFGTPPPSSYYYGGYHYQYPVGGSFSPAAPFSSQPAAPLPPPSPPRVSTWDFLNPLETFEIYYPEQPSAVANHAPGWTSSAPPDEDEEDIPELEDEEGMPELEDEEGMPALEDEGMPELENEEGMKPELEDEGMPELEDKEGMPELEDKAGMPALEDEGMPELEDKAGMMPKLEDKESMPELEDKEGMMPKLEDKEGMPELEDKEGMPELKDKKLVEAVGEDECTVINNGKIAKEEERSGSSASEELQKSRTLDAGNGVLISEEPHRESIPLDDSISSSRNSPADEGLVEERLKDSAVAVGLPAEAEKMFHNDVEVIQEIKAQFDHASKSAGEVCKLLEVGKVPYSHNCSRFKVASMMICGLPSRTGKKFLGFEEAKSMECVGLSTTLQKLYMWEKRLLEEVKAEEKIRILYDQKYEEAKFLFNSGAEAHKLEAVQNYTRKLSTKISVAIQAVTTVSNKINKLRDEELWPQTIELIQGFMQMWHGMSECHQIQCRALSQAKHIDSTVAAATFSQAHFDLVKQFELHLLDTSANFAAWFSAHKSYASTLNEWLKKGIAYVAEVTDDDGVPPFSPGRLGAPPVFTVYNNWAASMTSTRMSSETTEAVDAMLALASSVLGIWERQRSEWRRRRRQGTPSSSSSSSAGNKDMGGSGRELRLMTRDELAMRRALEAQKKKLVLVRSGQGRGGGGGGVSLAAAAGAGGLHSSMRRSFEAMESLAAACAAAFKDLHLRPQEEEAEKEEAEEEKAACSARGSMGACAVTPAV